MGNGFGSFWCLLISLSSKLKVPHWAPSRAIFLTKRLVRPLVCQFGCSPLLPPPPIFLIQFSSQHRRYQHHYRHNHHQVNYHIIILQSLRILLILLNFRFSISNRLPVTISVTGDKQDNHHHYRHCCRPHYKVFWSGDDVTKCRLCTAVVWVWARQSALRTAMTPDKQNACISLLTVTATQHT